MNKKTYRYKIKELILFAVGWEIIFWFILFLTFYALGFFGQKTNTYLDFEYPSYFNLVPLTMLITLIFIISVYNQNKIYQETGKYADKTIFRPTQNTNLFIRYFLFKNTITFLIIALAQPAIGVKSYSTLAENTEIMLAIDVSNSMNVTDINQESRLNIAKRAASAFIKQLTTERISIVCFAEDAITHLPSTSDYNAANMYIQEINTDLIRNQGSDINPLFKNVLSSMENIKGVNHKLIVLTDGEFHTKLSTDIKNDFNARDIQLAIVGIGTEYGGFVPNDPSTPELGYKTSSLGTTVISKVDRAEINRLAKELKGFSLIVNSAFPDLNKVYLQLKEIQPTASNEIFVAKNQKFHIPVWIAIISFIVYIFWNGQVIIVIDDFLKNK